MLCQPSNVGLQIGLYDARAPRASCAQRLAPHEQFPEAKQASKSFLPVWREDGSRCGSAIQFRSSLFRECRQMTMT
jgi:hypothetical protein